MRRGRRRTGGWLPLLLTVSLGATAGCIGATDRADFDAEVRRRGGGVTVGWIADALDVAAGELGAAGGDDVQVLSMTIDPGARRLVVTARRGDRADFVDTVTVQEGRVSGTTPMRDADDLPLESLVVRAGALPLDRIDELADEAVARFGQDDAAVDRIRIEVLDGERRLTFDVSSPRQTGEVVFDADGAVVEVDR